LDQRPEKEFVLDWALRLAPLLAAAGWEVFLTRTNDVDLTIAERVAMTDAVRPDLFLSLHFNSAAPDLTRSGVETYCITPVGLPSTLTRNYEDHPNWSCPTTPMTQPTSNTRRGCTARCCAAPGRWTAGFDARGSWLSCRGRTAPPC
jgi:N-acetylmuramoyl-L-alanine amidase